MLLFSGTPGSSTNVKGLGENKKARGGCSSTSLFGLHGQMNINSLFCFELVALNLPKDIEKAL
jgi:hypothetical protein